MRGRTRSGQAQAEARSAVCLMSQGTILGNREA